MITYFEVRKSRHRTARIGLGLCVLAGLSCLPLLSALSSGCVSNRHERLGDTNLKAVEFSESEAEGVWRKTARTEASEVLAAVPGSYTHSYVLAPQDTIEVAVLKHPEVSRKCLIRADGNISLPILGDVQAGGQNPMVLAETIKSRLSERLLDPEVSVMVLDARPPSVYVLGAVAQTRAVQLREAPSALQALTHAGGLKSSARRRDIVIIRIEDGHRLVARQILFDIGGRGGNYLALANVPLKPDDVIFVPRKRISVLSTFLSENIIPILSTVNQLFSTYTNYQMTEMMTENTRMLQESMDSP